MVGRKVLCAQRARRGRCRRRILAAGRAPWASPEKRAAGLVRPPPRASVAEATVIAFVFRHRPAGQLLIAQPIRRMPGIAAWRVANGLQ